MLACRESRMPISRRPSGVSIWSTRKSRSTRFAAQRPFRRFLNAGFASRWTVRESLPNSRQAAAKVAPPFTFVTIGPISLHSSGHANEVPGTRQGSSAEQISFSLRHEICASSCSFFIDGPFPVDLGQPLGTLLSRRNYHLSDSTVDTIRIKQNCCRVPTPPK